MIKNTKKSPTGCMIQIETYFSDKCDERYEGLILYSDDTPFSAFEVIRDYLGSGYDMWVYPPSEEMKSKKTYIDYLTKVIGIPRDQITYYEIR